MRRLAGQVDVTPVLRAGALMGDPLRIMRVRLERGRGDVVWPLRACIIKII